MEEEKIFCSGKPPECPFIPEDRTACHDLAKLHGPEVVKAAANLLKSSGMEVTGKSVGKIINLERALTELASRFGTNMVKKVVNTIL
jgi:hypothetical protein